MRLRTIISGLAVAGITVFLLACGETSSPTAIPVVATDATTSTLTNPATVAGPGTESPPPTQAALTTETPSAVVLENAGETPAPQGEDSQRQFQSLVFYDQDGLVLEYYWPLDDRRGLSADETEILAYNYGSETIEFRSPSISFMEGSTPKSQSSGTWEKFSSAASWDRIEYIQIPPSSPTGGPLLVLPGEKAKLHWHMGRVTGANTSQSVNIDLTVVMAGRTEKIFQTLTRGGSEPVQSGPVVTATPAPQAILMPTAGHDTQSGSASGESGVIWRFNGAEWSPNSAAPDCDEPLGLQTPVDLTNVTSALWPGQQRGAYVAHGGFRFDNAVDNNVIVRAPIGSHLVQASHYLEGDSPQWLLFFSVPCGFFYRFDHVLEVPPDMAEALKDVPLGGQGDSRTSFITPPFQVNQGEIVGTAIGIGGTNIFVDFGLYDVRQPNNVIPDPAWADLFAADNEFGHYGVCFFDYLTGTDGETMRSLPTGKEGTTSDFCD